MKRLPTFRGYTVDRRLSEFRKLVYGRLPEFIPFESPKGQRLLRAMGRERERQRRDEQEEPRNPAVLHDEPPPKVGNVDSLSSSRDAVVVADHGEVVNAGEPIGKAGTLVSRRSLQ